MKKKDKGAGLLVKRSGQVGKGPGYRGAIGVEKGRGPRHADNAQEGMMPSTDTVPAMLTPREAVLNRNAAEMAGRGNIEKLNADGNALAEAGVDLAGGKNMKKQKQSGAVQGFQGGTSALPLLGSGPFKPMPWSNTPYQSMPPLGKPYPGPDPRFQGGPQPVGPPVSGGFYGGPQPLKRMPSASFYPQPAKVQGYAEGTPDLPQGSSIEAGWGPPPALTSADISRILQLAQKEHGLSKDQVSGLMSMFSSYGGSGSNVPYYGEGSSVSQALGPALEGAYGGYQGGISDIGYPPGIAPSAEYHADKGSNWIGPYDQQYRIPVY